MAQPSLHLATPCYGGAVHARYMRSLMALRRACAAEGVRLQLDLGGGEALVGRARAGMLARFLAGEATHLLFADSEAAFTPKEVFDLLRSADGLAATDDDRLVLIARDAAQRLTDAHPDLHATMADVRGSGAPRIAMLFEGLIEPETGAYVSDLAALRRRWKAVSGIH